MSDSYRSNSERENVSQAAGIVGFYTFLSRILGLVRDMVIARVFGSGMVTDAFFVAFKIPNLLRRLFAEGSLTIAFIPVFTENLREGCEIVLQHVVQLANPRFTGIERG